MKSQLPRLLLAFVLVIISACQASGSGESTSTQTSTAIVELGVPDTQAPTRTPLPEVVMPDPPPEGEANVYGRFVWQGHPIAGVHVILQGRSQEGGAIDEERVSNEEGAFYFLNIPIGEQFNLIPFVPEDAIPESLLGQEYTLDWIVLDLPSGENVAFGNIHLLLVDLKLDSPERGASVSGETLELAWNGYPGAYSYRVELKQHPGDYVFEAYETSDTTLEIQVPELACLFGWDVSALNEWGEPYARSDQYRDEEDHFQADFDGLFLVEDPDLPSCDIRIISPNNNRTYEIGDDLELAWEPNPLAVEYLVLIKRTRDARNYSDNTFFRSNYVAVDENGQPVGLEVPELSAGEYTYLVIGYTEDGLVVAESEWRDFTIE